MAIVRGVIRYSDRAGGWRFFESNRMPYAAFDAIDLARIDGVIGGFYDPDWVVAAQRAGIAAVLTE